MNETNSVTATSITILYNESPIIVDKFKFALYSHKFRNIPNILTATTYEINSTITLDTFKEFMNGAQGNTFKLSPETALDFFFLCDEWKTNSLNTIVLEYIKKNVSMENICSKIAERQNYYPIKSLELHLAQNLDESLKVDVFSELPIRIIKRIINYKEKIVDHHNLLKFVLNMLEKHSNDALCLVTCIDIRVLTNDELISLLENPVIEENFSDMPENNNTIMQEKDKSKSKLIEVEELINNINEKLTKIENANKEAQKNFVDIVSRLNDQINELQANTENSNQFEEFSEKLNKMDAQISVMSKVLMDEIETKASESEKKSHKELRKTNKVVNGLTRKTSSFDITFRNMKGEQSETTKVISTLLKSFSKLETEIKEMNEPPKQSFVTTHKYMGLPLSGIMAKLNDISNQNAHLAGTVNITSSTSDHNEPYQLIDFTSNDVWFTENKLNQWVKYDFIDHKVRVLHYTIKTHKYPAGSYHLKSWAIEGSNDNSNWEELDKRAITVLNGPNRYQTFPCTNSSETFRYIRLRQVGLNSHGDHILSLANFEIFGDYIEFRSIVVE